MTRADDLSQQQTADLVKVYRPVVVHWEKRFLKNVIAGLSETQRPGRKPSIEPKIRSEIITEATIPPKGRTQWSSRTMAQAKGVSANTVQRLWRANGIKSQIKRTFKISDDKNLETKFWDDIGLYLDPPERLVALCSDEKSQSQALERTQLPLPLRSNPVHKGTHDYIRHGTITLFAAPNYLDEKICRRTAKRQTHKEWQDFMKHPEKQTPEGLTLHLIVDN